MKQKTLYAIWGVLYALCCALGFLPQKGVILTVFSVLFFLPGVLILGCFVVAMVMAPRLKVLCLGDSTAAALGVRVKRLRLAAMACAAGCAAAVVSFAGLLGFVGLVVPHIARRLVGQDPGKMLPTAALTGGTVVVLADLLGRTLAAPSELPVGILMSVVGAPYFLLLLVRRRGYADI